MICYSYVQMINSDQMIRYSYLQMINRDQMIMNESLPTSEESFYKMRQPSSPLFV